MAGEYRVSNPSPDRWYDRTAFAIPRDASALADFGNVGRNSMQEDGIFNWDIGLQKAFQVTESLDVQFRREVFNMTNHPSFAVPNRNVRSPAGGTIRGTNTSPRQMQFGLRISF